MIFETFFPQVTTLIGNRIHVCLFLVFSVSVPESWAENSNRIIQRSQNERSKSAQLRTDSDSLINQSASDIWNAWNATNSALSRRASEILETKSKLQMHLHKVRRKQLKYSVLLQNYNNNNNSDNDKGDDFAILQLLLLVCV
jgi:hypothetical protein